MLFRQTHPDRIEPEALYHLNSALLRGGNMTLSEVLDCARNRQGTIITIERGRIVGAMYLERLPESLNIVLLGAENIQEWKDELVDYLKDLIKQEGVEYLCVLGRQGWNKLFHELTPVGMLYRFP